MEIIESNQVKRRIPEVVVYEDPRKRPKNNKVKSKKDSDGEDEIASRRDPVVTMKRARFDVHKFGIQGFDKTKKEEAHVQLAISLGARPPKKKFYNYKEYIAKRKEEKLNARQRWLENKDKAILKSKKPSSKKDTKNTKKKPFKK